MHDQLDRRQADTSFFVFQSDYAEEAYERVAWELSLSREKTFFTRSLTGEVDGYFVGVYGQKNGSIDEVLVQTRGQIPDRVSITPANPTSPFRGLRCGDEGFDTRVYVMGPEAETIALLGHDTRRMVMDVVAHGGAEVEDGAVKLAGRAANKVVHGRLAGEVDGKSFARFVRRMIELAKRLSLLSDGEVAERLAHNVEFDERVGVRRKNLALLSTFFGATIHARAGARSVLSHYDYNLRLDAAIFLADSSVAELDHLEGIYREKKAPTEIRLTALHRLLSRLNDEGRSKFLTTVLRGRYGRGRARALVFCRQHGIDLDKSLLSQMVLHSDPETASAACALAGALGRADLQRALVHALRASMSGDVRCQAASALGLVGNRDAVQPLRRVADSLIVSAALKVAAETALGFIRSRLLEAPGGLSLTDVGGKGAVSFAPEPAALSLTADDPE